MKWSRHTILTWIGEVPGLCRAHHLSQTGSWNCDKEEATNINQHQPWKQCMGVWGMWCRGAGAKGKENTEKYTVYATSNVSFFNLTMKDLS